MLKTYLYLPDELNRDITRIAKDQKKSKAEIIRYAIKKGLNKTKTSNEASLNVLFELAKLGKKNKLSGPKDGAVKVDTLLWGTDWDKQ